MTKQYLSTYLAAFVTLIAAFGFRQTAFAQPLAVHAAKLDILGEAGHWKGTGKYGEISFTCEMVRTWSEDKGTLFFTQRYFANTGQETDEPVQINSGMFGWDASKKKIKSCWFITDGRSATDYFVAEKGRLVGTRDQSNADGTETVHLVTLELHPDGRMDYRTVDKKSGATLIEIEWIPVKPAKK